MKIRWLINGLLLILVVLLGWVIRNEISETERPPALSGMLPADALEIEIEREGEPTLRLGRSAQGWRMESPLRMDANEAQVDKLLGILATGVHRSFPETAAPLNELGLDPPKLRLRIDTLVLAFGDTDPVSQFRYIASAGLVHLIEDQYFHLLIGSPLDYVSPRLLPRGFEPVFGRVDGMPLAADALDGLSRSVAERLEPLAEEIQGLDVALEDRDGTLLKFQISEDGRRWSRKDERLLYVLSAPPDLTRDPDAIDPTPAVPDTADRILESSPAAPEPGSSSDPFAEPMGDGGADDFALPAEPYDPAGILQDPDAPVPPDAMLGPPPAVRLRPDGEAAISVETRGRLHGEPDKIPPFGFGEDPFAPDPAADSP